MVKEDEKKLDKHTEFESKYRVEPSDRITFKLIAEKLNPESFIYVEGTDVYYVNSEGDFLRYRKPTFGMDVRAELTMKKKPKDAKNNIQRQELNLKITGTHEHTVDEMVQSLNFKKNFSIWKTCDIYKMSDATLVFYTVADTTEGELKKISHFIEIEVSEKEIFEKGMTENDAWAVIGKYELLLADLGITPQRRLKRSLFEMYKRE